MMSDIRLARLLEYENSISILSFVPIHIANSSMMIPAGWIIKTSLDGTEYDEDDSNAIVPCLNITQNTRV